MIQKEILKIREDGVKLYLTYSDEGMKIKKIGTEEIYDEAVDVETSSVTYEETDQPIEQDEPATTDEILNILLGDAE